ncbi:pentatricopeptide repeat-containing protein At4g21705, mitochondrial-like isoform X2 [Nicotiana tabacum]|uniref:Pentatricopeptide repeat-containing protein At4g21705, mitochondrial-like isoform X2 n=1 Tax=Nicotiana tabacum TaxID=4097 RepID=A0A1S4D0Q5_TOBAC|nr:pentatricopeptide repeat-containing protein At4g21705, mitochondrial isoform X2 [Nicotiana tomentosiformis]XP_016506971.1 PREDICTED: pentatricopeptide repeat-containing protein At4g21705, mitochondrial-like isoform X2 [Nicotiana tabacum]
MQLNRRVFQSLTGITCRFYHSDKRKKVTLYSKISPLGDPNYSVTNELDEWVCKGKKVRFAELQRIILDLRKRKRFNQALEASEWMKSSGIFTFSSTEHAVQLDLIGKMMQEKGLSLSSVAFNDIMSLYTKTGEYEKIPEVLHHMKEIGVCPDNLSYRICINSYGARSDIEGMERVLIEMENQSYIVMDWNTYAAVANIYVKSGLDDKANSFLKKAEAKIDNKEGLGYNYLISVYSRLGNKDEVIRLWFLEKSALKRCINRDYINMLESLVRLDALEEAEQLLKEWETSDNCYDIRVPYIVIIGYIDKKLYEKAETMLEDLSTKGKTLTPNIWGRLAAGYLDKGKFESAVKCIKVALSLKKDSKGWKPDPKVIMKILSLLGENGSANDAESFLSSLRPVVSVNREMYHVLLKSYIAGGKEVERLLNSMRADNIDENEETKVILEEYKPISS